MLAQLFRVGLISLALLAPLAAFVIPGSSLGDFTSETKLTNNTAADVGPKYSPAGDRIVYASDRDGNLEVYEMNADGSGQTRLTFSNLTDMDPSYTPDGNQIVFHAAGEVFIMNFEELNPTQLTFGYATARFPVVSPDGTRIAFASDRFEQWEIFAMDSDGTNVTQLTSDSADDTHPSFSPDGNRIVFSSNRTGNCEIFTMTPDGGNLTQLTNNSVSDDYPVYGPAGDRIAFTSGANFTREIVIMDADGSNRTPLTSNSVIDEAPHFSPDGERTVFQSNRDGDYEIFVGQLPPVLEFTPNILDFGTLAPGETATQPLSIRNNGSGVLTYTVSESESWLTVTPSNGTTSGEWDNVSVVVDTTGLTDRLYATAIAITTDGGNGSVRVAVIVETPTNPVLRFIPNSMDFGTLAPGGGKTRFLFVRNAGSGALNYSLSESEAWLTVTPSNGTSGGEWDRASVVVDTTGLTDQLYTTAISIASNGGNGSVMVAVTVETTNPILRFIPSSMDFGTLPPGEIATEPLFIRNNGSGVLTYAVSETEAWLTVTPSNGTSNGEFNEVSVVVDTTGLTDQLYTTAISIASNGGNGSVMVAVTVETPTDPVLAYRPVSLDFGTVPPGFTGSMALEVANDATGILLWSINATVAWIVDVAPTSGSSTGEWDAIRVSVDASLLPAGDSSSGAIVIRSNGGRAEVEVAISVAPFDFRVSVPRVSIPQGETRATTVSVDLLVGTSGTVALTLEGLPSGATFRFSPSSAMPPFSSELTISIPPEIPPSAYVPTLRATGGGLTRSVSLGLDVTLAAPPPTEVPDPIPQAVWITIAAVMATVAVVTAALALTSPGWAVASQAPSIGQVGGPSAAFSWTVEVKRIRIER